jgi:chromosome segregation ATPase
MADNDFDKSEITSSIKALQEVDSKLMDRTKQLSRQMSDLNKEFGQINEYKHDLDARIRVLESEDVEGLRQEVYRLDSKINAFETQHDDSKEKWRVAMNFVIQLAWVSMAAWLLLKLGLQAPL